MERVCVNACTFVGTSHTGLLVACRSSETGTCQTDRMRVSQSTHSEWVRDMKLSQVGTQPYTGMAK